MIRKLFHKLLAPRHPWRTISFSELSEMYISSFLRTFSIGMVGIFIPLYLYQKGYTLTVILLYYAIFYGFGMANDFIVGKLIAQIGPKHVMRASFLLHLPFLLSLIMIDSVPGAMVVIPILGAIASTTYWLPYNVDFSKINHRKHGGKEVGYLQVVEKIAAVIAPITGGLVASLIHPSATFVLAAVAMFIASIVIMLTPEPVRTKQPFHPSRLNLKKRWRDYASFSFFCGENAVSILIWPIFLSIVVLTGSVYAKLGAISSFSVLVAILVALPLGKLLDDHKGKAMIKFGASVNSIVHIARIGVSSIFGAGLIAVVNEPNTLVYRIAFLKGYYDRADDDEGTRIAFIAVNEFFADILRFSTFTLLAIVSLYASAYVVCAVGFLLGATYSQLIRLERFPALRG